MRRALAVGAGMLLVAAGALGAMRGTPATPVPGVAALNSVVCPSIGTCVAVGLTNANGKSATIAAGSGAVKVWSGSLKNDPVNAVACLAKTSCLAVADDAVAKVRVSDGAMRVTAAPKGPANGIVALGAIACPGARKCYAVGFEGNPTKAHAIVASLSAGGKLLGEKKDIGTGLSAIACPTQTMCLMSDYHRPTEVIQTLKNGKIGGSHPMPANTNVQAMSCYKAKLCYTLSGKLNSGQVKIDELFKLDPTTGKPGHRVTIEGFSGTGISCISATTCLVSGFTGFGSAAKAAVVWVVHGKPGKPITYASTQSENFHAVACATTRRCYAVGSSSSGGIVQRVKG